MASKKVYPFVVAYGEEGYLLDRMLAKGRSQKGWFVTTLDGTKVSYGEVVSACETSPSCGDYDGRIVVLDNAQKLSGDEEDLEEYIEERDPEDTSVVLLAVVRSKELKGVWAKAAKKGKSFHFESFKPWQTDKVLARIRKEAKGLGLTLGEGVDEALYQMLGDNLGPTMNELKKLSHLVGESGKVEKKHVVSVVAFINSANAFQVADAAYQKRPKKAMRAAASLYKEAGDSASVQIVSALQKQAERLIVARQMLDKGDDVKTIARRFEMHPFACEKNLVPLARAHGFSRLRDQMQMLCRLEAQVKGAAFSKRTRVEMAVLSIST
jgi:DNA polymerase III delta subunit